VNVRFLADEDLDADIVAALRSREPAIDILDVKSAGLRGTKDPALLEIAAEQDRILITHDRRTMTRHVASVWRPGSQIQDCSLSPSRALSAKSSIGSSLCGRHLKQRSGGIRSCICPFGKSLCGSSASLPRLATVTCPAGFAGIWQNGGLGTTQRLAENPRR
jgi:hypothetical protein